MVPMEERCYQGDDGVVKTKQAKKRQKSPQKAMRVQELCSDVLVTLKKILYVLGPCVVVFVAVRNSLTLHLQNFWGASGNFWQHQWDRLLNAFGDDLFNLMVYGTIIVSYVVYWVFGLFYVFMDVTLRPQAFRKYKIQPGTNEPVDNWKLAKVVAVVHFNQLVVGYIASRVSFHLLQWRGYDASPSLPTFQWVLYELVVCVLVEEVGFYYSHRLFHHRLLYKRFHKQHHEWTSPISVTAVYAHPMEHLFSNLMPPLLGPLLLGSHMSTMWLWFQLAQLSTLNAHSGYHLPFLPSNEAHDYHHLKFNECYGVLGVLDLLHGTDQRFRSSKNFCRHVLMLSTTPARVLFPDTPSNVKPNAPDVCNANNACNAKDNNACNDDTHTCNADATDTDRCNVQE
ncbi:fatty acid hydroxylase domain-containing protein 2 [Hyalella azteca]|uniref:Fatty acid hydroxylase domain-containing protein 2 n=1 Tax=Hyalella azteca TaxID=294128 RepID=A0A8B7PNM9_HYAAZ|nr:fatty acid hydroxylase domain-containing protein 2 [Hyalella azteca]